MFATRHFGPNIAPVPWSETLPQVSLAGTLLTVLLLFFAAFGEPLLGRRAYAWLARSRDGDARALSLLYAVTMAIHVLWGLLVLVVIMSSPGLAATDLGLRAPHAFGPVVGGAIGGLLALAALWVLVNGLPGRDSLPLPKKSSQGSSEGGRRGTGHRGRRAAARPMKLPEPGRGADLLYPRTEVERGMAAGAAVTGGLFGELLYRGLFIVLMVGMGVPLWFAAVLSVLLFAVAQIYQGWWGVANGALSGTLFTVLYLGTGSLWVPVLVHVALNLRSLVFPPGSVAPKPGRGRDAHHGDDYDEAHDEYDRAYDDEGGGRDDDRALGGYHDGGHGGDRAVDHGSGYGAEPPFGAGPGRQLYSDEWIDHRYAPGSDNPGAGPGGRG